MERQASCSALTELQQHSSIMWWCGSSIEAVEEALHPASSKNRLPQHLSLMAWRLRFLLDGHQALTSVYHQAAAALSIMRWCCSLVVNDGESVVPLHPTGSA